MALTRLGRLQSRRFDEWHDEEPGRIPYQVRSGPLAVLNLNPYSGYYADFASPLMFVLALANLYAWTGDDHALRRHWDTARRVLDWARQRGDADRRLPGIQTRSRVSTKKPGLERQRRRSCDMGRRCRPIDMRAAGYWYAAQQLMACSAGCRARPRMRVIPSRAI
jgi:hypothetical protein